MKIDDAGKAHEVDSDDDISEPEEGKTMLIHLHKENDEEANTNADSIAGQMAALKRQPTADPNKPNKPKKQRRPVKPLDEESDYESGTDEDEESESETDTDTDTDDE